MTALLFSSVPYYIYFHYSSQHCNLTTMYWAGAFFQGYFVTNNDTYVYSHYVLLRKNNPHLMIKLQSQNYLLTSLSLIYPATQSYVFNMFEQMFSRSTFTNRPISTNKIYEKKKKKRKRLSKNTDGRVSHIGWKYLYL